MSVVTALSFPREHAAAEKSGFKSRDAQGCFSVLLGRTEKSHGKNCPLEMLTCSLLTSGRQEPSAK